MTVNGTVRLDEIKVGERARRDLGDLTDLMDSIRELGLLQPIVVTNECKLIAGGRRLEACRKLGMTEANVVVAAHIADAVTLLKAERDENTCRKDMTASELIALGRQIEALEKPVGTARIREAQVARWGSESNFVPANEVTDGTLPARHDSREKAAEAVGLSTATYSRIKQVANEAEGFKNVRGSQIAVSPERQAESKEALQLMDRIAAGEEVRPAPGKRPLTVTAVYEQWKGHKVNRGDEAPAERRLQDPAEQAAPPLTNAYGRRYPQRAQRKSLNEGMAALSGLCAGLARVTELDDSIEKEEAALWQRDLNQALRVLRSLNNTLKEHINGRR